MTQLVAGSQDGTPRRTGRRGAAARWSPRSSPIRAASSRRPCSGS